MHVSGRVLEFRKDGKGIKLDSTGEMYSVFAAPMLNGINIGDMVSFEFKEGTSINRMTGRPYLNITGKVNVTGASSPQPVSQASGGYTPPPPRMEKVGEPVLSNSRCIIRQNALTNAIKYCELGVSPNSALIPSIDTVLSVAKEFEAYTSGDVDLEEVKNEL